MNDIGPPSRSGETEDRTGIANDLSETASLPSEQVTAIIDRKIGSTSPELANQTVEEPDFGDYELQAEIARGGMGVVYRARQKSLNRVVALKMIKSGGLAGDEEIRRFQTEAEAAGRLDHPNIVPVYEVGEQDGLHYFSMAFVEGQGLDARLAAGPMPEKEAVQLAQTVAEAVQYAHERGIVHRDLKPGNILIDGSGQPRITDFGLAKSTTTDSSMTATGQVVGTPSYMPPEQAAGRVDEIGVPSDVYSLGAVLYALLTGRPPFQAANVIDTLSQVLEQDPVSPRQLNPAVNRDLETICLKCLEKAPDQRYASASDLAADLERFRKRLPISARPVSRPARLVRWCRRHPSLAFLIATGTVAVLLMVGLFVAFGYQGRLETAKEKLEQSVVEKDGLNRRLENSLKETDAQRKLALSRGRLAQRLRYAADIRLAQRFWQSNEVGRTLAMLEAMRRGENTGFRGFEWNYLKRLCHSERTKLNVTAHDIEFSPDGRRLAVGRAGIVDIIDAATGRRLRSITLDPQKPLAAGVKYSPDGSLLAVVSAGRISVFETSSWQRRFFMPAWDNDTNLLAFRPDGGQLACFTTAKKVGLWSMKDGRREAELDTGFRITVRPKLLEYSPSQRGLLVFAGSRLFGTEKQYTFLWNFDRKKGVTGLFSGSRFSRVFEVDWKNGLFICSTADYGLLYKTMVASKRPDQAKVIGHSAEITRIVKSADGIQIATASTDTTIKIWNQKQARIIATLRGHTGAVHDIDFSPDGRWIASASSDGTVRIWDSSSDQRAMVCGKPGGFAAVPVSFSADGCSIVSSYVGKAERTRLCLPDIGKTTPIGRIGLISRDGTRVLKRTGTLLEVTDFPSRRLVWRKTLPTAKYAAGFSPNGDVIAAYERNGRDLLFFDSSSGRVLRTIRNLIKTKKNTIFGIRFSSGGQHVIAFNGKTAVVYRVSDGRKLVTINSNERINSADVDSDRQIVAVAEGDVVHIRSLKDGRGLSRLVGHANRVTAVRFSPDRRRIATASVDRTVRLWDAETSSEVLALRGHRNTVLSLLFDKAGRRLASGSRGGIVRVWDARPLTER